MYPAFKDTNDFCRRWICRTKFRNNLLKFSQEGKGIILEKSSGERYEVGDTVTERNAFALGE